MNAPQIYPDSFEAKVGFTEIRTLLRGRCLSSLGAEMVDSVSFSVNAEEVNRRLREVSEFRRIMDEEDGYPDEYFLDMRSSLVRIQLQGSYLDEGEMHQLKQSLTTIAELVGFLNQSDEEGEPRYPSLHELTCEVAVFPSIVAAIDAILNKFGKIKDNASPDLQRVRLGIAAARKQVGSSLRAILASAKEAGHAPADASPTLRDGRMVIPAFPAAKRRLGGIVHDESATGKTIYIEPTEVVEANNKIRSLEAEEQRIIIRILQEVTAIIRPEVPALLDSYRFLGRIDLVRAKALVADAMDAIEPVVEAAPVIDWHEAVHPLLQTALRKHGRKMNPLDICLTKEQRILLISGPNAGGKSVCLSTAALLQYMVQCGLAVPLGEGSRVGMFDSMMIDIGDEQSIQDELSTYSGHLYNMKQMMRCAGPHSLILIDEMGGGTEPQIGAAIAQAMLHSYLDSGTFGIITTHYQNLKYFARDNEGIVNGAMLYDRARMAPLFQLQIGMPGSSFALEIARKIGLPEQVVCEAQDIAGQDYTRSDKYLQDIVRDKRYWENKRAGIHQKEKRLDELMEKYERDLSDLSQKRKAVIDDAKAEAASLLKESNAKIENTIRAIREAQAEREETRQVRAELEEFRQELTQEQRAASDAIDRKMEQIRRRRERHEQRKAERQTQTGVTAQGGGGNGRKPAVPAESEGVIEVGGYVRLEGQSNVGRVERIKGSGATVVFGNVKTNVKLARLVPAAAPVATEEPLRKSFLSKATRDDIYEKKLSFRPEIDVRGYNGLDAVNTVTYFIEDAALLGVSPLRILHGTGTGFLRQTIRQYLKTMDVVASFRDEHVQFGGAGITIVELR